MLVGAGNAASRLNLRSGCGRPALGVACAYHSFNYVGAVGIYCGVTFAHLRVVSPGRNDGPGQYAALLGNPQSYYSGSAIALQNAGAKVASTTLRLFDFQVNNVPGSCITAYLWTGYVTTDGGLDSCNYPGAFGVMGNSVVDWWLTGFADVGGAGLDNYLFSGAFDIHLANSSEVAGRYNLYDYGSEIELSHCNFGSAAQHNIHFDSAGRTSAYLLIENCYVASAGSSQTATYGDLDVAGAANANVILSNTEFGPTTGAPSNPAYNIINERGAHVTVTVGSGTIFDDGPLWSAGVANNLDNIIQPGFQSVVQVPNAAHPGTTLAKLAKLTGAGTVAIAGRADTTGEIGIVAANAGTTGAASVVTKGITPCVFDGATTANDAVQISAAVAGDCHDTGSTRFPSAHEYIGYVLSTQAGAGTYAIYVNPQR